MTVRPVAEAPPSEEGDGGDGGDGGPAGTADPVRSPADAGRTRPTAGTRLRALARRMVSPTSAAGWVDAGVIVAVVAVALSQLHPNLLFADTTTAGGDTGAHVMLPAFLKNNLLPHGQLTGWDPDWYDGFPVYTFYFPLPGILTVLFNSLVTYNVAFKLVTVLGSVTLPLAAWAFGKLAGLRAPGPGCLAAATLPYLFEPSFTIYGGNLLSTLAGEFSYSLGLSFALVFLGVVARGLHTGRLRALAAVLLAATVLCHIYTAIFAVVGAGLWLLLDSDLPRAVLRGARARVARRRVAARWGWVLVVLVVGGALTAWWAVPFVVRQPYTNNMGWTNLDGFPHLLFPASARWVQATACVGLVATVVRRNRVGLFIALLGGLFAAALCLDPQGKFYNVRFLPLWFVCLYLMAGFAVGEVVAAVLRWDRRHRLGLWVWAVRGRLAPSSTAGWHPGLRISRFRRPTPGRLPAGAVVGPLVALLGALIAVLPPLVFSPAALSHVGVTPGADQVSAWSEWNYSGYEGKADYPEYKAVVDMMGSVGAEDGCGRAMWEYNSSLDRFGTTMSLMLLPQWTHGCIDSMEGLLFESSPTTPYHFLNQNELSAEPDDAMAGLPYGGLDVPLGIEHLQQLGVRYLLVSSPSVQQAVAADPAATLLAQTGPWPFDENGQELDTTWKVYAIGDSAMVAPLADQPVVWDDVAPAQTSWDPPSIAWYLDPSRWDVVPTAGGPASWARIPASDTTPTAVPEPTVHVSDITTSATDGSISFHVDRTGVPVVVKVSYFPNWQAIGAEGPWRAAPNLMVVVPTSHEVVLHYGTTGVDVAGWVITAGGVAGLGLLVAVGWRARRRHRRVA